MELIPFAKPFINDPDEILADIKHLLVGDDGQRISNGENCRRLEEQVAKLSGAEYGVATSSCTMAMATGLGACSARGTCWTQAFTWASTAVAGQLQGSIVTFRDIDRERWAATDYKVSANPREGERAYAIAVDTFGMQHAPESYVPLFFDRAHSLGVRFRMLGVASFISFSPSKILTGQEGGMILTDKERYLDAMVNARDLMCRMPEMSAVLALHGLRKLGELLEWKRETYNLYKKKFPECQFQTGEGNHQVIGMLFPTKELRDSVIEVLRPYVEFKAYYEPLHLRNPKSAPLRVTEDIYSRILCLPSWYDCPRDDIVEMVRKVME